MINLSHQFESHPMLPELGKNFEKSGILRGFFSGIYLRTN